MASSFDSTVFQSQVFKLRTDHLDKGDRSVRLDAKTHIKPSGEVFFLEGGLVARHKVGVVVLDEGVDQGVVVDSVLAQWRRGHFKRRDVGIQPLFNPPALRFVFGGIDERSAEVGVLTGDIPSNDHGPTDQHRKDGGRDKDKFTIHRHLGKSVTDPGRLSSEWRRHGGR